MPAAEALRDKSAPLWPLFLIAAGVVLCLALWLMVVASARLLTPGA